MPVMFNVQDILDGTTTAVLVPAVTRDQWCSEPDAPLQSIDDLPLGGKAYEVQHAGPLASTIGGKMTIKNLPDMELVVDVVVTDIELVRANELTPEHYAELGPRRTPMGVDWIAEMGDRRAWFLRLC